MESKDLKIGDVVPMPPRKLDIRPNAPINNKQTFKSVRSAK